MLTVNAMGDACPIPVIKTKKAIEALMEGEVVETLVDNEVAVQNLTKLASQKGCKVSSEKIADQEYKVTIIVGAGSGEASESAEEILCTPGKKKEHTVVVFSSSKMGEGNDELGAVLVKGFIYALTQMEELPETILFYNGGATLTCTESPTLEDLKSLEAQGVEILTCGTCLNYYGLSDKLQVGSVTNMYVIVEKMIKAGKIVKPC